MAETDVPEEQDSLPEDLDVTAAHGRYTFPDIRRRRLPGWLYLGLSLLCFAAWAAGGRDPVLVNAGFVGISVVFLVLGVYHLVAGWPLAVRDLDALVAAAREVGFPVGHASAQLGWRGLLSRPTWRLLLYSGEDPPESRALVLVDAVDGLVLSHFVEANPEDWNDFAKGEGAAQSDIGPSTT
ncbi:MAG: hypothetical protein LC799_34040 [Actinobacteria bacterium]|nr:hypothetical protein [Actinomycetota bacterium]